MTQPPVVQPPMYYQDYGQYEEPPPVRPTVVTVIAILGIILGGLALACLPINAVSTFASSQSGIGGAPPMDPVIRTFTLVTMPFSFLVAVGRVVAGIGRLGMKRWAWKLAIGLLIWGLIENIITSAIGVVLYNSGHLPFDTSTMPSGFNPQSMMGFIIVIVVIVTLIWEAAQGVVLWLLLRQDVREAMDRANDPYIQDPYGQQAQWPDAQPYGDQPPYQGEQPPPPNYPPQ